LITNNANKSPNPWKLLVKALVGLKQTILSKRKGIITANNNVVDYFIGIEINISFTKFLIIWTEKNRVIITLQRKTNTFLSGFLTIFNADISDK